MGKQKWKEINWKDENDILTYNSWRSMRNRCLFDNNNNKYHKQRGITICDKWIDNFDNFIKDMGKRPSKEYTLDRIDGDGNYEPNNCRWATWEEQNNNKIKIKKIEHNGENHTLLEWCRILDLTKKETETVRKRYYSYNVRDFYELFTTKHLLSFKINKRKNKCLVCGSENSCHFYYNGKLCNTCYARAFRWSKKENKDIKNFHEWKNINFEE